MSRSPFTGSGSGSVPENLGRRLERHTLRSRDRGWQRLQEWGAVVVDLPPQQHGVVLVRGVVAVLHEHPAPVSELQRDGDAAVRPEPIDVLASPFPRRHLVGTSVASEDLALLEMNVDRVIPATAVILQSPDLASAVLWGGGDPPEVCIELVSIIRADSPGAAKRCDG